MGRVKYIGMFHVPHPVNSLQTLKMEVTSRFHIVEYQQLGILHAEALAAIQHSDKAAAQAVYGGKPCYISGAGPAAWTVMSGGSVEVAPHRRPPEHDII